MKKAFALLSLLFVIGTYGQQDIKNIRKKSYETYVYKLPADSAEKYMRTDSIPVNIYLEKSPHKKFLYQNIDDSLLGFGQFLLLSVDDNEIVAEIYGISNLRVVTVNNNKRVQIAVRDKDGNVVTNAKVFVDGKITDYNSAAKTFEVRKRNPDEGFVKVCATNDTTFVMLENEYEEEQTPFKQRFNNFKLTGTGKILTWLPDKIVSLFSYQYNRRKHYRYKSGNGYVLLNQPKYKLTDTVKLKAYIFNERKRLYKKGVEISLQYYFDGKLNTQMLGNLKPVSPGAYVYSFPLSDTLHNDQQYDILFKGSKKQQLLKTRFTAEDYLLDEIAGYKFRSLKDQYYKNDSLIFYASATDANNLLLLDATGKLLITRNAILSSKKDSLYVADTLAVLQQSLSTNGETKFAVSTNNFPEADLSLNATLVYNNSNNEMHKEYIKLDYKSGGELYTKVVEDTIVAEYRINGKPVAAKGEVEIEGGFDKANTITYPYKAKIDPLAEEYTFYLYDENKQIKELEIIEINEQYHIPMSITSKQDTMGFVLYNRYKLPVYYTVLYGNNIVAYGSSSEKEIKWTRPQKKINRSYKVKWEYMWGNKRRELSSSLALLHKMLDVKLENKTSVYPGQEDSIKISVKDYLGKPAGNVNLSSVAYNAQFKNSVKTPDPPYLQKYQYRNTIAFNKFISEDAYIQKRYLLGDNRMAIAGFGLDTLLYYQMLLPNNYFFKASTSIGEFMPQVSVYATKNGVPQEIYLLYLNRELVYYNGVTDKSVYSFSAHEGYTQIAFRLLNRYIEIDSIYLQPYYKYDIVFDLDKLPATVIDRPMPDYYTPVEIAQLEKSIWQISNNAKTNDGYVWQNDRLVNLSGNKSHIAGPFKPMDSLHFFSPANFDIHFLFEPGYEYNLSKQIERLEKKSLFPSSFKKVELIKKHGKVNWILGDTIIPPPQIKYDKTETRKSLKLSTSNPLFSNDKNGSGSLQFIVQHDTLLSYVVIEDAEKKLPAYVLTGRTSAIPALDPGRYNLHLVTSSYSIASCPFVINDNFLLFLDSTQFLFKKNDSLFEELVNRAQMFNAAVVKPNIMAERIISAEAMLPAAYGNCSIRGIVLDKRGKLPVYGAIVIIKGTSTATISHGGGIFLLKNLRSGRYTLKISSVGYETVEINADATQDTSVLLKAELKMSANFLQEVIVTGYATVKKRSLTESLAIVDPPLQRDFLSSSMLQGKVAGISLKSDVLIRGMQSFSSAASPLYLIDGIAFNELPPNITQDMMADVAVLGSAEAVGIYGAKASGGVVLINTKTKEIRSKFRDYAFWQPDFYTDKNGQASFAVKYPDNVTGWQAFVLAMDKHKRVGKGTSFITAFKPVMAQLSLPQFLLEGDSVYAIGKNMNYTQEAYTVKTIFSLNGVAKKESEKILQPQASLTEKLGIAATASDTMKAMYKLETTTGFKDGEEKSIPVLKTGTEEITGSLYILKSDTSFSVKITEQHQAIEINMQNNTLDLLLDELKNLKRYPYYCMEQTASKLHGLLIEKRVAAYLKEPFKEDKEIELLIQKLQKAQLYEGGWSWWSNGSADDFITNYVIQTLLKVEDSAALRHTIRDGLLYLQNNLPKYKNPLLLNTLETFAKAGHSINYSNWLNQLAFDSLSVHEQWQYIFVKQYMKLPHETELANLVKRAVKGITGSVYWGENNFKWYSNANATTALAYTVLEQEKDYKSLLTSIIQFFFEQKKQGYWSNTVESATITATLLPAVLKMNANFVQPSVVEITGDTSFTVSQFPYHLKTKNTNLKQLNIRKRGGGLTYVGVSQHIWNTLPISNDSNFIIQSRFEQNGRVINNIRTGEIIKMVIDINAKKEAEYVMIEIPIPAGCVYADKSQDENGIHKEFIKNKVLFFVNKLATGAHQFIVRLEPRYSGLFTLNPVKAQLMYFPFFNGNNKMKRVEIVE